MQNQDDLLRPYTHPEYMLSDVDVKSLESLQDFLLLAHHDDLLMERFWEVSQN